MRSWSSAGAQCSMAGGHSRTATKNLMSNKYKTKPCPELADLSILKVNWKNLQKRWFDQFDFRCWWNDWLLKNISTIGGLFHNKVIRFQKPIYHAGVFIIRILVGEHANLTPLCNYNSSHLRSTYAATLVSSTSLGGTSLANPKNAGQNVQWIGFTFIHAIRLSSMSWIVYETIS